MKRGRFEKEYLALRGDDPKKLAVRRCLRLEDKRQDIEEQKRAREEEDNDKLTKLDRDITLAKSQLSGGDDAWVAKALRGARQKMRQAHDSKMLKKPKF